MSAVDALRAGLESGDFGALGECYADDAVLDLNMRGGRERVAGPAAIVARLEAALPGPGPARRVDRRPSMTPVPRCGWSGSPTPTARSCASASTCCCATAA